MVVLADLAFGTLDALGRGRRPRGRVLGLELTDAAAIAAALVGVGPIEILVNDAGILSNTKGAATTLEEWRRMRALNVEAARLLIQGSCRGCGPRAGGGSSTWPPARPSPAG